MTIMIEWLHTYHPQPIFFSWGNITIRWYGVCIIMGTLLGLYLMRKVCQWYEFSLPLLYDIAFSILFFGFVGDRLYYVVYAWTFYRKNWLDIFRIWEGGLAIHGGIIAGILVLFWYAFFSSTRHEWIRWLKKWHLRDETFLSMKKWVFWSYFGFLLDLAVIGLFSGLMIGRWGNYFNQELFGKPTALSWGIPIASEFIPETYGASVFFHPTFLYESLMDAVILSGIIVWDIRRRNRLRSHPTDQNSWGKVNVSPLEFGNIGLGALAGYAVIRFIMEFFRIDYSPLVAGVRWAQIMSVFIFILAGVLYLVKKYWYTPFKIH